MKKFAALALCLIAVPAFAVQTASYGWEDGNTILGNYGDIIATNVAAPVYSGAASLKLEDAAASGTPQAYVGWITGLQNGDQVTAGFWCWDNTPGASPSGRIWGHYTNSLTDINAYAGSASGPSSYSGEDGVWSYLEHTWTFDASTDRTGLVIEARTYSNAGDTVWVDDINITAPDHATITMPGVPEPATLALLAIGGLVAIRRR